MFISNGSRSVAVESIDVQAYRIPTEFPESDGTLEWNSTTIVLVIVRAGGLYGIGYTYAATAAAHLIHDRLAEKVLKRDVFDIPAIWSDLVRCTRNMGEAGISAMAVSAVDSALWDLKARLLRIPLVRLLGSARDGIRVYGSGGFTSYSISQLEDQLEGWVNSGIRSVKMKVGRNPDLDLIRVESARRCIGTDIELFVDANGGYSRKQAMKFANAFADYGVTWFEEPVCSDDLEGLHFLRDRAPAGMEIAAGEYGFTPFYFRRMLEAQAVDVLQADATRCQGISGFLHAASLCQSHFLELSSHTAPSLHAHLCCALLPVRHLEYFHDHVRIEQMLFDGVPILQQGNLYPHLDRPGNGLELKRADAERYAV